MKDIRDLINDRLLISIRQFGKEVGISRQTIMGILKRTHKPTFLTVKKICRFFDVDWREYWQINK